MFDVSKPSNFAHISSRNLAILVLIPVVALVTLIIFLNAAIAASMNIRGLVISEHADEGQRIDGSVLQNNTSILAVNSYWNKDKVTVALFTNDLDPIMSALILRNVTSELSFINEEFAENQTESMKNSTNQTENLAVYGTWTSLLRIMQERQGIRLPELTVIDDDASKQNANIKIFFEGKPHPEGRGLGVTTAMYDSQTREIDSVEIHIYQSYQSYEEGIIGPVLRHELGHALGLGHSTDMSSIMYKRVVIKNDRVIGVIGQCESDAVETAYVENNIKDISCKIGAQS